MTINHYDPSELDRVDPSLDALAEELEAYAAAVPAPPPALSARILEAVEAEPPLPTGWRAALAAWMAPLHGFGRGVAAAAVVAAAVVAAIAFGAFTDATRENVGTSPGPSVPAVVPSPSEPSMTPSLSPSPTISPSPTASPSPSPSVTPTPPPVAPTPSDDDEELETPEPSDDDNSGPGGGGSGSGSDGDNSGPGGGDD